MERFEVLQLFADAGELDRFVHHRLETQGRAAARVAVQLSENGAGDGKSAIEMGRDVDSFLAGGSIEHQQDLVRLDDFAQTNQLLHQRFVDLQPAGGVENYHV